MRCAVLHGLGFSRIILGVVVEIMYTVALDLCGICICMMMVELAKYL